MAVRRAGGVIGPSGVLHQLSGQVVKEPAGLLTILHDGGYPATPRLCAGILIVAEAITSRDAVSNPSVDALHARRLARWCAGPGYSVLFSGLPALHSRARSVTDGTYPQSVRQAVAIRSAATNTSYDPSGLKIITSRARRWRDRRRAWANRAATASGQGSTWQGGGYERHHDQHRPADPHGQRGPVVAPDAPQQRQRHRDHDSDQPGDPQQIGKGRPK